MRIPEYFRTYKVCLNVVSLSISALGLILSLMTWRFSPDYTVPLIYLIFSVIISLIFFIIFVTHSIFLYSENCELKSMSSGMPRISRVIGIYSNVIIIYTTKSNIFTKDLDVTLCFVDYDGCERVLCYGNVIHVQDRAIQLGVSVADSEFDDINSLHKCLKEASKEDIKIYPGRVRII